MIWIEPSFHVLVVGMVYFEQAIIALPVMTLFGVMISVAGIAGVEGVMRDEKSEDKVHFLATGRGLAVLLGGVFVLWLLPLGMLFWWDLPDEVGGFGDMFGSVTALFSGLAFAGLIAALFMQRQELTLQRRELGFQRKELELSRGEFKLQRFENTLFGLLELFNGHVQSLEICSEDEHGEIQSNGRGVLQYHSAMLANQLFKDLDLDALPPEADSFSGFPTCYRTRCDFDKQKESYLEKYDREFEGDLGPYFRLLYNIMRHIDKARLAFSRDGALDPVRNTELQQKYSKIVRAYLGSAEIKLLMFNCTTHLGEDFRGWVISYQLLKHIHPDDVTLNPEMVKSYGNGAFGRRYKHLEMMMDESTGKVKERHS
ncbi:putative phage abortive infection protein [Halocynthiibacter namhaensis]|uniref:putative phage abortive infection protein n=1 Tax=Halocynthiibacter namhaensis TaxID=1290553 RepID=UPI00138DE4DE|nr:putative phage abortive infection protein [Halocynthiibacter namhaensis]